VAGSLRLLPSYEGFSGSWSIRPRARRLVHAPMGRLAQASETARAALFLASEESSYVNGATFLVDGGITAAYGTAE
jgi:NAD(P)-dependent dehydrogenase (short-subunit alcohol dehydrogenase family)